MRRRTRTSFNTPSREYDFSNESRFRSDLEREIGRLSHKMLNVENVSGSSISKGVFRKNTPFFRASITDY